MCILHDKYFMVNSVLPKTSISGSTYMRNPAEYGNINEKEECRLPAM
jgi:hypothetical protein